MDPGSLAARAAAADPTFNPIARTASSLAITGNSRDLAALASAVTQSRQQHETPVILVYDIPKRDLASGYSAGGASTPSAYLSYTRRIAAVLGVARAVVILEPDSLAQMTDLSFADQQIRYALLSQAVSIYARHRNLATYLDGGNSGWTPAAEMARRLERAGVGRVQGFAVNVSNFYATPLEAHRAEQISALTGGARYVVDTSRNGGTYRPVTWCNPPKQRLGQVATTRTEYPHADAYLWIKHPGESDGHCAPGEPPAGEWFPGYARQLLGLAATTTHSGVTTPQVLP